MAGKYSKLKQKIQRLRKPLTVLKEIAADLKIILENSRELEFVSKGQLDLSAEIKEAAERMEMAYDRLFALMLRQRKEDK